MFTAFVYRGMTAGFADYLVDHPTIPGPMLQGEVGDVLVVHFRNADTKLRQAVTMHPHGVKYNPEYDGAYMGEFTRDGGFVAPGESFTYQWECTPDSVGAWLYHDHGPNHTLNSFRGLFGAIIVRAKGEKKPDRVHNLFAHQLAPPVTGLERNFHCFNGRAYAGNTPILRARPGEDVEVNVFGQDSNYHTFHIHGHRWKDAAGAFTDNPGFGANESIRARFVEDNPGRWLYHCHVFSHQDVGMAGWYVVDIGVQMRRSPLPSPLPLRSRRPLRRPRPTPSRKSPGRSPRSRRARFKTHTVCKGKGKCDFTTIQKAVDKAKAGDTIRSERHLPGGRARQREPRSAT